MVHAIEVRDVAASTALARELTLEVSEFPQALGAAFGAEYGFIQAAGLRPAGEPFVTYRERLAENRWNVAICAPIAEAPSVPPPPGLVVEHIPGGLVATTLHRGPYETISEAYTDLGRWIPAHGYRPVGPPRERYLSEPDVPPEDIRTIVEFPVEKIA